MSYVDFLYGNTFFGTPGSRENSVNREFKFEFSNGLQLRIKIHETSLSKIAVETKKGFSKQNLGLTGLLKGNANME